ncbi:MAG: hypothetical protein WBR26_05765 [Candidatus Acidiferrum sp.]
MRKADWFVKFFLAVAFTASSAVCLIAQPQPCSNIPYLHQNKFDPQPLELHRVQGAALDQNGKPVAQLCLGLFSTPDHKLMRFAQADRNGNFSLDTHDLPDGEYRLVGQLIGFCPANAIIDINSHFRHKKPLVVHMNLPGTDTCSYVELRKK